MSSFAGHFWFQYQHMFLVVYIDKKKLIEDMNVSRCTFIYKHFKLKCVAESVGYSMRSLYLLDERKFKVLFFNVFRTYLILN